MSFLLEPRGNLLVFFLKGIDNLIQLVDFSIAILEEQAMVLFTLDKLVDKFVLRFFFVTLSIMLLFCLLVDELRSFIIRLSLQWMEWCLNLLVKSLGSEVELIVLVH